MQHFKYNNAIINITGKVDRKKLEEATIRYMKKVDRCRRNKLKEKIQNGNNDTPRAV